MCVRARAPGATGSLPRATVPSVCRMRSRSPSLTRFPPLFSFLFCAKDASAPRLSLPPLPSQRAGRGHAEPRASLGSSSPRRLSQHRSLGDAGKAAAAVRAGVALACSRLGTGGDGYLLQPSGRSTSSSCCLSSRVFNAWLASPLPPPPPPPAPPSPGGAIMN